MLRGNCAAISAAADGVMDSSTAAAALVAATRLPAAAVLRRNCCPAATAAARDADVALSAPVIKTRDHELVIAKHFHPSNDRY